MRRATIVLLICAAVVLPAVSVFAASRGVPRGAYVRTPVSTVDELANQVTQDPVVRNRFARHFGVPPEELGQYIRDNVVIRKVTSSTPENVYICTRRGQLVSQHKVLRKGTAVFALKDTGEPLLVQKCGNPVIRELPTRVKVKAVGPEVYRVMRPNEIAVPPVIAQVPPVVAVPPPAAVTPVVPPVVVPPAAIVPPVVSHGRGLALLPLAGLAFVGESGGGGPPPVPEPGGVVAVLATAFLPLVGWGLRRRRS